MFCFYYNYVTVSNSRCWGQVRYAFPVQGLVRQSLLALTANLEDSRFSSLPEASAAAKVFSDAIKSIVFNLLMHKVREFDRPIAWTRR